MKSRKGLDPRKGTVGSRKGYDPYRQRVGELACCWVAKPSSPIMQTVPLRPEEGGAL